MAKDKKIYARRLSLEESKECFIFISKDALSMFPALGKAFSAKVNGHDIKLCLESVFCTCRGPGRPHSHYRLSLAQVSDLDVRRGSTVKVEKDGERFIIEIR